MNKNYFYVLLDLDDDVNNIDTQITNINNSNSRETTITNDEVIEINNLNNTEVNNTTNQITKVFWCLHEVCLESIECFYSEDDLRLHTETFHQKID